MTQNISKVYDSFIWKKENIELAEKFYNNPPRTMLKVVERIPKTMTQYQKSEWLDEEKTKRVKASIRKANSDIGCLTPEVERNIQMITNGGIEAAHQSVVLGGPCYILNKAATASIISQIAQEGEHKVAPFFFVADYDVVQPELTNIRTPLMGQGGNLVSLPVPEGYEYSPVSVLPLPEKDWYYETEESIRANYHPLFKDLDRIARRLYEERLEHALTVARSNFHTSSTLDEWAVKIMGTLMNLNGDLGIPLVPTSNIEIKNLLVEGMEFLLARENREIFVKVHQESTDSIRAHGFVPGSGDRSKDYVPFYFECPKSECHRSRTELVYDVKGTNILLTGTCPTCGDKVEIETDINEPDLREYAELLSPRVDSRQIILDKVLPVLVHVGGAGETAYYAQVIPVSKAMNIPFPIFVKYPRAYFNTPYNETLGGVLSKKKIPVLHQPEMFKYTGKANRARRKGDFEGMNASWKGFQEFLFNAHQSLNTKLDEIKLKLETPEGKRDADLVETRLEAERYLSWVFGQYTEEKMGQESSWSWIEWAINSGLHDLFGPYHRTYVPEMKNGGTIFINFII